MDTKQLIAALDSAVKAVRADLVAPAAPKDAMPNARWTHHGSGSFEWWSFKGYEVRKDSADQWVLRKAGEELYRHTYLQVVMAHAERAILAAAPTPIVVTDAPLSGMERAFSSEAMCRRDALDLQDSSLDARRPAKSHCQNGGDVCLAGNRDGVCCPEDSCDIDDGVRAVPRTYTTQPGESVMGIALRQCGNEMEWRHILACNPEFARMLPHEYFPVGTVLTLPRAQDGAQ